MSNNPQTTEFSIEMYKTVSEAHERKCLENKKLKAALSHALNHMSRDQQRTMYEPTYEDAVRLLA